MEQVFHEIPPVWDSSSRILILGSFPSVKSREENFFYGHPQNRFWKTLSAVLGEALPSTVPEKKELLLRRRIALWDVIASCRIEGSSDSSIRDVVPNDLNRLLKAAPICQIFTNGSAAARLYERYCRPVTGKDALRLPSTSPANAAWSLVRLEEAWSVILDSLEHTFPQTERK